MMDLDKKLAEWAGIELVNCYQYLYPDGSYHKQLPDFPQSLDACFKWLVPKLSFWEIIRDERSGGYTQAYVWGFNEKGEVDGVGVYKGAETPALALCKAIEKLIK